MQIYLARNQVQAGPYTLEQLNRMLASHEVELSDLMWHEGMEQWRAVGEMTGNTHLYQPNGTFIDGASVGGQAPFANPNEQSQNSASLQTTRQTQATDKQTEVESSDGRTTVEQLYGRTTSPTDTTGKTKSEISKRLKKTSQTNTALASASNDEVYALAGIGSRILAVLVDQFLAMLCLVPLLSGIGFDFEKLSEVSGDPNAMMQLMDQIPQHLLLLSSLLILALFCVQVFMLIKRGQTLGKLINGVRILDATTKKLPSITNLILLRTILTNVAYNLPVVGQFVLLADFIAMVIDKQRRSLHDRLAKTMVFKAHDKQIDTKQKKV